MSNLEKATKRLKSAFIQLEYSIENKMNALISENKELKLEVTKLNQELKQNIKLYEEALYSKKRTDDTEQYMKGITPLVNKQASSKIDLSLSELKKLVK